MRITLENFISQMQTDNIVNKVKKLLQQRRNTVEKNFSEEDADPNFKITEIKDYKKLLAYFKDSGYVDAIKSRYIQEKLKILTDRVGEVHCKLFVVETLTGKWLVAARSQQQLPMVKEELIKLNTLQNQIDPKKLGGQCIYAHGYAHMVGISSGVLSASGDRRYEIAKSLYPTIAQHYVGVIDLPKSELSVYFDLTTKIHVLAEHWDDEAIAEGIIIIDKLQKHDILSHVYQCNWKIKKYDSIHPYFSEYSESIRKSLFKNPTDSSA